MKKTTRIVRIIALLIAIALTPFIVAGCAGGGKDALDPKNPVTVTIWNYYNGDQLAAFEQLLEQFNSTVGAQKGIVAVNVSQGDINTLADSLIASVNNEVGAQETPVLAAVYSETAYILNKAGKLEALDDYFKKDELSSYIPGFLDEGRFGADGKLLLFPILKSSEIFTVNETDWAAFADATGITIESVATKEDLTKAAKAYYEWTDSLTPDVSEDGKALYGRDSVANYVYVGSRQLGHEIFKTENGKLVIDLDKETFKTLWDNYYIPYINGYFGAYAKFRSEDCKTGKILSLTSSSSSAGYLPVAVTRGDDTTNDITTYTAKDLPFANAKNDAVVQQGASYCMIKSTKAEQAGAVEFIKWFTQPERNLSFALMSGYSPVSLKSNTREAIETAYTGDATSAKGINVLNSLITVANSFTHSEAYAVRPFNGSKEARAFIEDSLKNIARDDREKVTSAIAGGQTREEAVKSFSTDEYFSKWFEELRVEIDRITAQ